jgi:alkanesulfonate monooxygenase SsuD/methylene tetrahydromethanopterin reductase-like flavin-dependent oxidoreductase (luciferase family)
MLDLFARDRELTLGFGRGAARREFEGMRVPMGESRERFAEAVEIVRLALTREQFSFEGHYYRIPSLAIRPRPRRDLTGRFYGAIVSPESGEIMARAGMGMLIIPQKAWTEHALDYQAYKASCAKFGGAARRPIAVCMVYCHRDEKSAHAGAVKWMGEYADSALRHYEYDEPEHFKAVKGYEHHAQMAAANRSATADLRELLPLSQVAGTPERCLEVLKNIRATVDAEEFVGIFKYGTMPQAQAERSMKLFATEVLPKVHAL